MTHVAIVLPGRSYGPDMPGLAIPIAVLQERGAHVVTVQYLPDPWPDWRRAEHGDWSEITDVVLPQIADALTTADRVTVIAKSMGTSVFGAIRDQLPRDTEVIWVTPLFGDADVRAPAIESGFRSLSVYGTADSMHDPAGQREVTEALNGDELGIDGANHGLVVEDDPRATEAGHDALRRAVTSFMERNPADEVQDSS